MEANQRLVTFSVHAPISVVERIERLAKERGSTRSAVVREACERLIREEVQAERKP